MSSWFCPCSHTYDVFKLHLHPEFSWDLVHSNEIYFSWEVSIPATCTTWNMCVYTCMYCMYILYCMLTKNPRLQCEEQLYIVLSN